MLFLNNSLLGKLGLKKQTKSYVSVKKQAAGKSQLYIQFLSHAEGRLFESW